MVFTYCQMWVRAWHIITLAPIVFADVRELQAKVSAQIRGNGLHAVSVASLLEQILEREPGNVLCLCMLSLHNACKGKYTSAHGLAQRLHASSKASTVTQSIATDLVAALRASLNGEVVLAVSKLRRLSSSLAMGPRVGKLPLHSIVEVEAMNLARKLDSANLTCGQPYDLHKPEHYVPGLRAKHFWPPKEFQLALDLEISASVIEEEVLALENLTDCWRLVGNHTAHGDKEVVGAGTWTDVLIFKMGRFHEVNCRLLPQICKVLSKHVAMTANPMGLALVSRLDPGTEVAEHVGFSNSRLTLHLALKVPGGKDAGIVVNGEPGVWRKGKVLAFDDSFPHAVWHRGQPGSTPRIVLLVRIWHPDMMREERLASLQELGRSSEDWREQDLNAGVRLIILVSTCQALPSHVYCPL